MVSGGLLPAEELILNGGFELGERTPQAWGGVDGLTCLWEASGHPGRCLRFATAVLQSAKKDSAGPTIATERRDQYKTVGAHEGVWAFAAPVSLKPDDRYFKLAVDIMGPAKSTSLFYPQVLVRGYQKYNPRRHGESSSYFQTPHAGGPAYSEMFGAAQRPASTEDYLMVYRNGLVCRLTGPGKWQHFQMGIKIPTIKKYRPEVLLIKPYAMWPLGNYYFDNLSLQRIDKAEYDALRRQAHSIKGFTPSAAKRKQP
jgi:hypothetical protein